MSYSNAIGTAAKLSPALESALAAVHTAIEGMSDEQMKWHPEGKWCASEILEHLSLTYSRTAERIKPLLGQELPDVRRRIFKDWLGVIIVLKLGHMPAGRKAPQAQIPQGMSPADVRISLKRTLSTLDRAIDQCERRFGRKTRVLVHHALGPLSVSDYRRFHYVHTVHHMKQIRSLRRAMAIERIR